MHSTQTIIHKYIQDTYTCTYIYIYFNFQKYKKKPRRSGNKEGRLEVEKERGEIMYAKLKNLKFYGTSMCMFI